MFPSLNFQFAYFVVHNHSSTQNAVGHSNMSRPTAENLKWTVSK